MTHECGEVSLDAHGHVRTCALDSDHDGAHVDPRGESWEPPQVTLARLRERWGHTHAIA